ncbi:hypothetical protein KUCAC02_014640, partial [Chaenocephalus aceratus]
VAADSDPPASSGQGFHRPWVHGGEASRLGKNARGLEWPGLGNGLAIVPQEKHYTCGRAKGPCITAVRASNTGSPRLSCPCRPRALLSAPNVAGKV